MHNDLIGLPSRVLDLLPHELLWALTNCRCRAPYKTSCGWPHDGSRGDERWRDRLLGATAGMATADDPNPALQPARHICCAPPSSCVSASCSQIDMEVRKFTNRFISLPSVAYPNPTPVDPGKISPPHSVFLAAAPLMMAEDEAMQQMRNGKKQKEQLDVVVASSLSSFPPMTPELRLESLGPLAGETLSSDVVASIREMKPEGNQAAATGQLLENVGEAWWKQEERKRLGEGATPPSQSVVADSPIMAGEYKTADAAALAPVQGKNKRWRVKELEQSVLSPLAFDVHPQGGKAQWDNVSIRSGSNRTKKPRMPSIREIMRMRIEARRQHPMPQSLVDAIAEAANSSASSTEQNPNHSSPFGAFFDQFRYIHDRRQNHNSPIFPETPDHLATSLPRRHSSSEPSRSQSQSQLNTNGTSKAAKTTALNISVSHSQETLQAKHKEKPEKKINGKKQRKPTPDFEKKSDKYRRVPLDQLVPPPRSPHKLLQEKYASDPWKVIVTCMLLNKTQGKQVRKKTKGFFELYPDPQAAYHADTEEMKAYLKPLGLQAEKTRRIQKFSQQYVLEEWTHITELCGVGKYAADAYAIFCAGRAAEVVPEDHKLLDYWRYVRYELPLIQGSESS